MSYTTQLERDRADYRAWLERSYSDWLDHTGGTGYIWDEAALHRARRETPTALDAWRGPWRTVRPYVTTEFRQWIEEHDTSRLTFAEWQTRAKAERAAQSQAVTDWQESAGYCLSELEILHELLKRRGELIYLARERGASWSEVTTTAGLSRMQAHTLAKGYAATLQQPIVETTIQTPVVEWAGELCEVF